MAVINSRRMLGEHGKILKITSQRRAFLAFSQHPKWVYYAGKRKCGLLLWHHIYIYTPISKNVVGENDKWQLPNGNCTTERNCGFHIWYAKTMCSLRGAKLGSTTTVTKPPQICIFENEKQYFCTLCTWIFHLLTFWRRSRSFYDVKWPVLQFCERREHMMTNVQFCLVPSAGFNLIPG